MEPLRYLVRQPKTLESSATEALGSWITSQADKLLSPILELLRSGPNKAEDIISRQIDITRFYLESNLPGKFYNTLAVEVIRGIEKLRLSLKTRSDLKMMIPPHSRNDIIERIIETLFTKNLTTLNLSLESFKLCNNNMFLFSLRTKSYMLSGLNQLHLSDSFTETDIIQILKELHNLKHLVVHYCTHNIITCLAENCQLIENFESWNDENINETSIDILTRLPYLRSVSLIQTLISGKEIRRLLLANKNIELKISTCYSEHQYDLEGSLEHIVSFEENAGKQFNLIHYENSPETTSQLQLVVRTCPLIQRMHLYNNDYNQQNIHLLPLIDLQNLRELTLFRFNFYGDHVKDVFQIRGCNLVQLQLIRVGQIDLKALMCISQTCPNLQILSLDECPFEKQSFANETFHYKNRALESPLFRNLKRLSVEAAQERLDEQLFFLLSSCPNVEFIYTKWFPLTDEFMLNVLDRNPLIHLKELKTSLTLYKINNEPARPQLTMSVIDQIVQNCINPPEIEICFSIHTY